MNGQFFNLKERTEFYFDVNTFDIISICVTLAFRDILNTFPLWPQQKVNRNIIFARTVILGSEKSNKFILIQIDQVKMFSFYWI